jgi:hypothetical protein
MTVCIAANKFLWLSPSPQLHVGEKPLCFPLRTDVDGNVDIGRTSVLKFHGSTVNSLADTNVFAEGTDHSVRAVSKLVLEQGDKSLE